MAARTVLASSPFPRSLLSNPSPSSNSTSHAVSFSVPRRTFPLTLAAPQNPPIAAKEAASALDLTQDYEGQEETMVFNNEILLSDVEPDDELGPVAAVPKKRTSKSKKNIRKNVWKRKGAVAAMKAYSLAKSILTGKSTSFMTDSSKKDT